MSEPQQSTSLAATSLHTPPPPPFAICKELAHLILEDANTTAASTLEHNPVVKLVLENQPFLITLERF